MSGLRVSNLRINLSRQMGNIPENSLLWDDGTPVLWDDNEFVLWDV